MTTTIPITGNPDIAARTIIADRIGVGQITATEIAAATITGDRIAAGTITAATGNIGNLAVDTLQINNAAVTIPVFHTESPGVIWNGVAQFFTPVTITVTLPPFDSATAMVQVIFQITQTLSNVSAFGNIYVSSDGINYSLVASTSNSGQIGNTVALSTSVFGSNPNNFPLSLTLYVKPAFQGTASQGSTISVSVTILGVKR